MNAPSELLWPVSSGSSTLPPSAGSASSAASSPPERPTATSTSRSATCRASSARPTWRSAPDDLAAARGGAAGLGSRRLERRPGGAPAPAARRRRLGRPVHAPAPAALRHRRYRRDDHLLSRPAALPRPGAARGPRARRRAQRHAADLRGRGPPQSLPGRAVRRECVESHGAEGAVHRHHARPDPGPRPRAPTRS